MRTSVPLAGTIPEAPEHSGFALGRKGFRPFFLLAGAFAIAIVPLWLAVLFTVVGPGTYLDPIAWHAHEMVFGFTAAVIAGFLLTAVGNWTQRETLVGGPLLGLAALWIAGRVALFAPLPRGVTASIDLAFLPLLGLALARPLVATKNRRNFVMLGVIAALWAANLAVHLDALGLLPGWRRRGLLLAADVVVVLVVIITGRVVPMFTKNATSVARVRGVPALEIAAAAAVAIVTALDLALPEHVITRVVLAVAAIATAARMVTWLTPKALGVPLVWILHVGAAWVPIGLALRASSAPAAVATHALTLGAIGCLTLGMMARVSLGHSGRPLAASRAMTASFVAVVLAGVTRVGGALLLPATAYRGTLLVAGVLWTLAFAIFVVVYTPILTTPRADGKPG
jgi:uncharacterized protein involved in response to NO